MTKFDKVIPPGSEGKIYASIDLSHVKGQVQKYVDVVTNDPAKNKTRLTIKADVKTVVDVLPSEMVHFTPGLGESQSQELALVPSYEKPITLHDPTSSSDAVTVSMEKVENPQNPKTPVQYKLTVSNKKDLKVGTYQAEVKVQIDGAPQKELVIPAVVMVKGPIAATPPQVSFQLKDFPDEVTPLASTNIRIKPDATATVLQKLDPGAQLRVISHKDDWYQVITQENKLGWVSTKAVKGGKPSTDDTEQTISVRSTNGKNFKILSVTSSIPQVKAAMANDKSDGMSYNIKVSMLKFDPKAQKVVPGQITVKTDDADQPVLMIPVFIDVL